MLENREIYLLPKTMAEKRVALFGLGTVSGELYSPLVHRGWSITLDTTTLADYSKIQEQTRSGYAVVHLMNVSSGQMQEQVGQIVKANKQRILLAGTSRDGYTADQIKSVLFLEQRGYLSVSRDYGLVAAVLRFLGESS